jgi:hypothetical protein
LPPVQSRTDVIEHREPALTIRRTMMTPNGEVNTTFVYAVDGQPHRNMAGGNDVTSTLRWEGPVLVIESVLETQGGRRTLRIG